MSAALLAAKHLAATLLAAAASVHVLVIKATWGPTPLADATVQQAADEADAFLGRASFGRVQLTATQTPWLDTYADASVCDFRDELVAQAEAGTSTAGYDRVVVVTPCAIGSTGDPATKTVLLGAQVTAALLAHELGHTFGMSHAGTRASPYGDPLDVMGDPLAEMGDPGALQKAEAGWLTSYRFVKVPGTYRLAALETRSTLPQALVVREGVTDLWIDHREAIGNDAYLRGSPYARATAGVLVHAAPIESLQTPFAKRKPAALLGLPKGKTFVVPHVLSITVIAHRGTTVTVRLAKLR